MKKLGAGALVMCLLFAASAEAKTLKLTGKADGDSNSKITLKVKVNKDGIPTKVKKVSYSNVDTYVVTGPSTVGEPCAIGEQSGKIPGAKPSITRPSPSSWRFNAAATEGDISRQALGSLTPLQKPSQAVGQVTLEQPDHTFCATKEFTLRK